MTVARRTRVGMMVVVPTLTAADDADEHIVAA
jgi:hypothetical protein